MDHYSSLPFTGDTRDQVKTRDKNNYRRSHQVSPGNSGMTTSRNE